MNKKVIILGGGVAGMSAAHELVERGFSVKVLEKKAELPGGKARSIPLKETAMPGNLPLPGEHGFRFFPGFYKHIIDTMKRIPFGENGNMVYNNLVECPTIMFARAGKLPLNFPSRLPKSLAEVYQIIKNIFSMDTGLKPGESKIIALKVWQLMTSSKERRLGEYENISWLCYTEAHKYSDVYRALFVEGLTRTLVAAKAELCNTKTNGDVLLQILFHYTNPEIPNDRILNGPTNDTWLFPWLDYLRSKGVDYQFGSEVVDIQCDRNQVEAVWVSKNGGPATKYHGDLFILAIPVERAANLIRHNSVLLKLDPNLRNIVTLSEDVAWMNGIQFYLKEDVSVSLGHIILIDSPWALTAISQAQFWNGVDLSKYGKGDVRGILSVDVSDWDTPGILYGLPAKECTKQQAILEVWTQLKKSLNVDEVILSDENLSFAYLDEAIVYEDAASNRFKFSTNAAGVEPAKYGSNKVVRNEEPLLVNKKNTWEIRNEAETAISNLFLASDYVKTNTDLATMEGANEAARRAVNAIIKKEDSRFKRCQLWELHEPRWLELHKWLDKRRYKKGLPWKNYGPLLKFVPTFLLNLFPKL